MIYIQEVLLSEPTIALNLTISAGVDERRPVAGLAGRVGQRTDGVIGQGLTFSRARFRLGPPNSFSAGLSTFHRSQITEGR